MELLDSLHHCEVSNFMLSQELDLTVLIQYLLISGMGFRNLDLVHPCLFMRFFMIGSGILMGNLAFLDSLNYCMVYLAGAMQRLISNCSMCRDFMNSPFLAADFMTNSSLKSTPSKWQLQFQVVPCVTLSVAIGCVPQAIYFGIFGCVPGACADGIV